MGLINLDIQEFDVQFHRLINLDYFNIVFLSKAIKKAVFVPLVLSAVFNKSNIVSSK